MFLLNLELEWYSRPVGWRVVEVEGEGDPVVLGGPKCAVTLSYLLTAGSRELFLLLNSTLYKE